MQFAVLHAEQIVFMIKNDLDERLFNMLTRCERCTGRKMILGLGAMKVKCPNCKGVGFIDDVKDSAHTPISAPVCATVVIENAEFKSAVSSKPIEVSVKKKRGRPFRVNEVSA